MKLLPFESIIFKTKLKEEEVVRRLVSSVADERKFLFGMFDKGSGKPYEGNVNSNSFEIKRIISYRNSFLPKIYGTIERDLLGGTRINITMRLNTFVIIFLFIWFGGVGTGFLSFLILSLMATEFHPAILIPLGMFMFGYVLVMGAFKYESKKSIEELQKIFDAELVSR